MGFGVQVVADFAGLADQLEFWQLTQPRVIDPGAFANQPHGVALGQAFHQLRQRRRRRRLNDHLKRRQQRNAIQRADPILIVIEYGDTGA